MYAYSTQTFGALQRKRRSSSNRTSNTPSQSTKPQQSGLTREELRQIVLDIVG